MSEEKKEELAAAAARATERFDALELRKRVERLKQLGILDDQGDLSARYGGPGQSPPATANAR